MNQRGLLYFCADLVSIRFRSTNGRWRTVQANLEEISERSMSLLTDCPIPVHCRVLILCPGCEFAGRVCHTAEVAHLGHAVGVQFDPGCVWSLDLFRPQHLLAVSELQEAMRPPCSCCSVACPALTARVKPLSPNLTDKHLPAVARAIAESCPNLNGAQLKTCFERLVGGEDKAFQLFLHLYGDRQKAKTQSLTLARLRSVLKADHNPLP
ncbi:MAG: hypothetical protein HY820_11485 [Acidobacteria bacterium]|nr:hypothetical protein [Acidobacteriota bacterium]